jgi:hypothetical protein
MTGRAKLLWNDVVEALDLAESAALSRPSGIVAFPGKDRRALVSASVAGVLSWRSEHLSHAI